MSRSGALILLAGLLIAQPSAAQSSDKPGLIERIRRALGGLGAQAPETPAALKTPAAVPVNPLLEKAGPSYLYPNPVITTGFVDPAITQENIDRTICKKGYTRRKGVRHVTPDVRLLVLDEYGDYDPAPRSFELDHFISLELGGSNDALNLWPEPYCPLPRRSDCFGAREKDVVENWLHKQVCDHKMSLRDAQVTIKTDWFAVYRRIKHLSLPQDADDDDAD